MKPRHGDVNTRFVFHGTGWKPNAKLAYQRPPFCALSAACASVLDIHFFRSDSNGEFTQTLGPWKRVSFDFEGTDLCFIYAPYGKCQARSQVGLAPPSVSATPSTVQLADESAPVTTTLAAAHFRAGERLRFHVHYPDGRVKSLKGRARRHGRPVGPAHAWTPKGGATRFLTLRPSDPNGTYSVRVTDPHGGQARTSFVVRHYRS